MIDLLLTQPVTVQDALDAMRAAYTNGIIADRMTYETRRSDGTFDAVSAVLRIDNAASRQLRYETSGFAFHGGPGVLIGAGQGPPEPRRVLVVKRQDKTAADMLTGIIPTGPLPQIWIIDGTRVSDPALGVIQFTAASSEPGTTIITGSTALGPVRLETDATTGRLITLRTSLRDGSVELRAAPTEPGDTSDWAIETDRRRLVSRIDQLAPNLAILDTGDTLPDISFQHPDGTGLALADWHESPPEGTPRAPWSLILFVDATSTELTAALQAAAETIDAITRESSNRQSEATPAERFWLRFRPLVVLVMPEDTALDVTGTRPDLAEVDVLYSARPDLTIDRLPMAPIVAVAIDRDRVIGALGTPEGPTNNGTEAPLNVIRFVDQLAAPSRNAPE